MAVLCCVVGSLSAETFGKFTYSDDGTSIAITGYPDSAVGAVEIPSAINGKPVTSINTRAFHYCSALTIIKIPSSVTRIGAVAFQGCDRLGSVVIPSSVTSIGGAAFQGCNRLISVTIPASVTRIDDYAFERCRRLKEITVDPLNANYSSLDGMLCNKDLTMLIQCPEGISGSVTIPDSVISIGKQAFRYCTGLTGITFPASITSIGDYAFDSCTGLTNVMISAGITSIGRYAFKACNRLTTFTVDPLNANYSSLDGILYNKNHTTIVCCPSGKTGSVTISSSVTTIGDEAFSRCAGLTSITIPAGITTIDDFTFNDCFSLTRINIPACVTSIPKNAFYRCNKLTDITVDPLNANYCSLDGVLFTKDLTWLIHCPGEKSGSITIPYSVTSIDGLDGCTKLTAITVDPHNSNFSSLDDVLYNKNVTMLIKCPACKAGSITIPPGVTSIADLAFFRCSNLTSITIPASVTSIGIAAFAHCTKLTALTVDALNAKYSSFDGVLSDKDQTELIKCPGGKTGSLTIPASIIRFTDYALDDCSKLTEIIVDSHNASFRSLDGVLYNKDRTSLILCPRGKAGNITFSSDVISIKENACIGCHNLTSIVVDLDNTWYSSMDGMLLSKDKKTLIGCPGGKTGNVIIPACVTSIGMESFCSCTKITSVTIPASITNIEYYAFENCPGLTSANFLGNAPEIERDIFADTASDFTVYYLEGKTGFTPPIWKGYKAVGKDEIK